jgi:hypothetical protein
MMVLTLILPILVVLDRWNPWLAHLESTVLGTSLHKRLGSHFHQLDALCLHKVCLGLSILLQEISQLQQSQLYLMTLFWEAWPFEELSRRQIRASFYESPLCRCRLCCLFLHSRIALRHLIQPSGSYLCFFACSESVRYIWVDEWRWRFRALLPGLWGHSGWRFWCCLQLKSLWQKKK